jgi:hypothetical protein
MVPNGGAADSGGSSAAGNVSHDAVVHCVGGMVEVIADGSSLNQILREIGRGTGMRITGSVADEPVYGRYGPAPASEILSTLLDGTGSNMLLREGTAAGPGELILTPRTGGVTPPDPNGDSTRGYAEPNVPGSSTYQRPREPWMVPPRPGDPGYSGPPTQPVNTSGQGGGAAAERSTPQQIYQQLQRMQQTQSATQQKPQ